MDKQLIKYFAGDATPEEASGIEKWRSESRENAETFLEAKTIWTSTQEPPVAPQHVLSEILGETEKPVIPLFAQPWVKYASAAVLVLALSLLFVLNQGSSDPNYYTETLADGSELALHRSSTFEIVNFTDKIREIKVSGKVYFDIERDENRPFIIHTDNARVEVLGTSFLVKTDEGSTEVSVESGLVSFSKSNEADKVAVKLTKGEMALVSDKNKGIIKRNNNNENYLAWKTKVITFNNHTMSEVEEILEDVYGIDVVIDNPDFANCQLTAKFKKKKPKEAIEIIARTFGVDYEFKKNKAVLKGKGC